MDSIGFVLITHNEPSQTFRLVRALNQVYSNPPIVVHHDFDQGPLDLSGLANVQIVRPHIPTQWCGYSVVQATLAGLELLFEGSQSPGWFAVLSGACYPTKRSMEVIADLERDGCDAYINHQLIDPFHLTNGYQRQCFRRYYSLHFGVRRLDRRMTAPSIAALKAPYAAHGTRCYAGSEWFTANRAVAQYIVASKDEYAWLANHLKKRHCPDETYFQTIVCNAPQFRISNNNYRHIDWSSAESHPKQLELADLHDILQASPHFARKFAPDSPVLNQLDSYLGVQLQ
jgi:hypothetical protein